MMDRNTKKSLILEPRSDLIAIYVLVALFATPLTNVTSGTLSTLFSSLDEIGAILFLGAAILIGFYNCHLLDKSVLYYACFLLWGCICSFLYSEQSLRAQMLDFVCCSKYMMTLFGVYCIGCYLGDKQRLKETLYFLTRTVTLLLVLYILYNIIIIGNITEISLAGSHTVVTSHIGIGLAVASLYAAPDLNSVKIWILLDVIIIIAGGTTKSVIAAIFILFLIYVIPAFEKGSQKVLWAVMIVVLFLAGISSFAEYYMNDASARSRLTLGAWEIIKEKGLFGYGYAMYGSSQAATNYSPLYVRFGFSNIYGMTALDPKYMKDTFWPVVFGQFGILGTVFFCLTIFHQIRTVLQMRQSNIKNFCAAAIILVYFVIMSLGSAAFFNPVSVPYAIILGLIFSDDRKNFAEEMRYDGLSQSTEGMRFDDINRSAEWMRFDDINRSAEGMRSDDINRSAEDVQSDGMDCFAEKIQCVEIDTGYSAGEIQQDIGIVSISMENEET